jgi:hypothetical protein
MLARWPALLNPNVTTDRVLRSLGSAGSSTSENVDMREEAIAYRVTMRATAMPMAIATLLPNMSRKTFAKL